MKVKELNTTYIIERYLSEIGELEFFDKCNNCVLDRNNYLYCGGSYIGKVKDTLGYK